MSILEVAQRVAPRIGIAKPSALFASTDATEVDLQEICNECAQRILKSHEWQLLKTQATVAGDGSTLDFSLPSDYSRMPKESKIWSTRWQRPLLPVSAEDDLRLAVREYDLVQGTWTLIGGNIRFRPALASDESAYYLYISNAVVAPESGSNKATFDADTDTFRLDDRVLELAIIWEWKNRKGLPYAEDMQTAELALAQAIEADKGARIITQSSRRNVRATTSYPWNVEAS